MTASDIPPGFRALREGERLQTGDMAWGVTDSDRFGWGVVPYNWVGVVYRPADPRHPHTIIRRYSA